MTDELSKTISILDGWIMICRSCGYMQTEQRNMGTKCLLCGTPHDHCPEPFTEHDALKLAVELAKRSPCQKSKRGVVIFNANGVLAQGWNHPPEPFVCTGDKSCREHCSKICVHAEQRALVEWDCHGTDAALLHVEVKDGAAVPSGPPSCWECSKLILLLPDIKDVWLLHEHGLRAYSRVEFHRETLKHCGLPMAETGVSGHPVCTCDDERCVTDPKGEPCDE